MCVKRCSKIYFIGLKNELVWGVFRYRRRYVTKTMQQVCKEAGGNRNVKLQCFSIYAIALALFSLL